MAIEAGEAGKPRVVYKASQPGAGSTHDRSEVKGKEELHRRDPSGHDRRAVKLDMPTVATRSLQASERLKSANEFHWIHVGTGRKLNPRGQSEGGVGRAAGG